MYMIFLKLITPLHSDVIQSTPSHGRNVHFLVSSGFGCEQ